MALLLDFAKRESTHPQCLSIYLEALESIASQRKLKDIGAIDPQLLLDAMTRYLNSHSLQATSKAGGTSGRKE